MSVKPFIGGKFKPRAEVFQRR